MATAQLQATSAAVRNLLVATDLSKQSEEVVRAAMALRNAYDAHATILYVLPREEYVLAGFEAFVAARDAARRDLRELERRLSTEHPQVQREDYDVLFAEGDVAECIFECARERKVDLIVVGTHGRRGLNKAVVGSVAESIFRHSEIPVLTIGPCADRSLPAHPKRVL